MILCEESKGLGPPVISGLIFLERKNTTKNFFFGERRAKLTSMKENWGSALHDSSHLGVHARLNSNLLVLSNCKYPAGRQHITGMALARLWTPSYPQRRQLWVNASSLPVLRRIVGLSNTCPRVACLSRGTRLNLLEQASQVPGTVLERLNPLQWALDHCQRSIVGIANDGSTMVSCYWIKPHTHTRATPLIIKPGTVSWIHTWLGHRFEVEGAEGFRESTLLRFRVEDTYAVFVVRDKEPVLPTPALPWAKLWSLTKVYEQKKTKEALTYRTFTTIGFAKAAIPSKLWASVDTYYHRNKHSVYTEYDIFNTVYSQQLVYVNIWEARSFIIPIPIELQTAWHAALLPYVSAWAGEVELEATALYGIRVYVRGARLVMHRDRYKTHALSAILNIDQDRLGAPWPLVIQDLGGTVHEIFLRPGEMLFYESARCMHGRPTPLNGSRFVNLFLHYRPRTDKHWGGDWYRRPTDNKSLTESQWAKAWADAGDS